MNYNKLLKVLSLLIILNSCFFAICVAKKGFSTKTPYEFIHPPQKNVIEDDWYNAHTDKYTCGAVHVSAVIRHGARNPGESDSKRIGDIHMRIKDNIKDGDKFKLLKDWTNGFPVNNNKNLNDAGESEQHRLGQRIARRLKSLFLEEDMSAVQFMVSSAKRTEDSALAFYEGIGDEINSEAPEEFDSEVNDENLRFHTMCQKYINSVENNATALKEYKVFGSSDLINQVLEKVITKLGVEKNVLEPADLKTMFVICGSEMAVFKFSPWCDLFDDEDNEIMQYWSDLKKYYKNGPAYRITGEQSCPLVAELFTIMDDVIAVIERTEEDKDVEGYLLGNMMFGHAETLGPLYAALGLFNDTIPLTSKNYHEQKNRLFRTSEILPFSANIMFILYECEENEELLNDEEEEDDNPDDDYRIQLFVNEKPMLIPGCKNLLCPYTDVREWYSDISDDCHFDYLCDPHKKMHDEL
ncbi:multiple inositol polyphosphate phosphatase 1 [Patella vulgata]|uniref:multiple inositol polyphosphate phosphatase 1 n=1 Tax=Patella vulgata TaxID=6465 RepID=UPI0021806356|nr:multiple inositol polyphosphate phosphatase 1 [Patella vulgata]XP_050393593.1 multiple inositol polyphosphate phosphatase 1 [Patella vulgata]XP_050393594.1 multiple inositol polyphosphate phosphatase 1 [Patella vulgata]XP_050393595.1 multiple inositol polyphosphate phosphatase 1 [Patella vulgata]XP_055954401.1 multiple inositol polyphosphate phosphatase 1 [Patella vulgata]